MSQRVGAKRHPVGSSGATIARRRLGCVLAVGLGAVAAGGGFAVPFAVRRLVFDRLGTAGDALLGGGALGGGKRCGMGREGFRKHAVDGVGPAAVMLNDLVGDEGHDELACFAETRQQRGESSAHSMTK